MINTNLWVIIEFFLVFALISYFFYTLYSYLRINKNSQLPDIESENWKFGEKEITFIYKKDAKPNQSLINEIKNNMENYHAKVFAFIKESEEFKEYKTTELTLEGVSFPALEKELNEFDFSLDYLYAKENESFLVAYFKDEKVLRLLISK